MAGGPGQNTPVFAKQFEKMAVFQPVYIKLPQLKSIDIITEARADNDLLTFDKITLLPQPLSYFKVKRGFIKKYLALDILKDIESIESVGPDGKIIINQFNVRDLSNGKPSDDSHIERDPDEILRKRGLL